MKASVFKTMTRIAMGGGSLSFSWIKIMDELRIQAWFWIPHFVTLQFNYNYFSFIFRTELLTLVLVKNVNFRKKKMILVHIYISEHKFIRDLNVSVNGSFSCKIGKNRIQLRQRNDTSSYYNGHFCSAIIGPNGVGKSTILDFIEMLAKDGDSKGVIIFFDQENKSFILAPINYFEVQHALFDSTFKYEIVNSKGDFFSRYGINIIKLNNLAEDLISIEPLYKKSNPNVYDLTKVSQTKTWKQKRNYFNKLLEYFSDVTNRESFVEEVYFEFDFLNSPSSILDNIINDPSTSDKYRTHFINWKDNNQIKTLFNDDFDSSPALAFQNLLGMNALSILKSLIPEKYTDQVFPHILYRYVMLNSYNERLPQHIMLELVVSSVNKFLISDALKDSLRIEAKLNEYVDKFLSDDKVLDKLRNQIQRFLKIADVIVDNYSYDFNGDSSRIKVNNYDDVRRIIREVNLLPLDVARNISWGWRGLSSGENAKIHIFSESYHYLRKISEANKKEINIFLMDEVDLFLHPEWQRKFLSEFLWHIMELESIHQLKPSQIIICTHSPIIISDFIADDITSLRKKKMDNGIETDEIETMPSVGFGSTITDIYMEGMHLDSVFGELSRIKVERLMKKLESNKLGPEDKALVLRMKNKNIRSFFLYHDKDK
ncbi:AAA family ATPase [Enterobacter asburiae]|uniref:AAA family ATPase n=1 Tax=Enterobacter asburiae TaxID=61645 RepID=UPI003F4369A9